MKVVLNDRKFMILGFNYLICKCYNTCNGVQILFMNNVNLILWENV